MMWIEAVLASLLLLVAMQLASQSNPPPPVLLNHLTTWQLEDRAALLAEFGSDAGLDGVSGAHAPASDADLRAAVFNQSEPFCYAWAWLNESNSFDPSLAAYSYNEEGCRSVFDAHPATLRALRRGVWRSGQVQFLYAEQAPRT